jgi:hypothetical protein
LDLNAGQVEAIKRAAQYWVDLLMTGVDKFVNVNVFYKIKTDEDDTLAFAGPIASVDGQIPMMIVQEPDYIDYSEAHASATFYSFPDILELQSNLPHGGSYESVAIHEMAHIFGINSALTNKDDFRDFMVEWDQEYFFSGDIATEVYNDNSAGEELMPLDNRQIPGPGDPIDPEDPKNLKGVSSHIGVFGSVMGYGIFRNYPALIEVELAALEDIGYDFDRRSYYGRSIYTSGTESSPNTYINTDPFFARNSDAYIIGQANVTTYGVGLHIFGDYNRINQHADIYADGTAAAGVRIDGVSNRLTIDPGYKVTANGARGAAVLLAFGSNHEIVHRGIVEAKGENSVGIRVDFGMSGNSAFTNSGQDDAGSFAYSYWGEGFYYNDPDDALGRNFYLNGPAANAIDITGDIIGGYGPRSAAIYVGPGAHVKTINFMRPLNGITKTITGDIITDYDVFHKVSTKTTVLNFGYVSDDYGRATPSIDAAFDLTLDGKILGYDADWAGAGLTTYFYQMSEADTFLGRGLFDLNFMGGKTTVNDSVWVNSLTVDTLGSLVITDNSSFKTKAYTDNRLTNIGNIYFDVTNSLSFDNPIYGGGRVYKTGSGNLIVNSAQPNGGISLLTIDDGTLTLGSYGKLGEVTVNQYGVLAGVGEVQKLNVFQGGVSPGLGLQNGTLYVTNSLTLMGATIYLDLGTIPNIDLISAGTLTLSATDKNKIDLHNWQTGSYLLSSLTNSFTGGAIAGFFQDVFLNGTLIDPSLYTIALNSESKEIWLTLLAPGRDLTWSGNYGPNWSAADNWKGPSQSPDTFANHEYVAFTGEAGIQTVNLTANVLVAGMIVSGGNYQFTGSNIVGRIDSGYFSTPTGKLEITGSAKATFRNTLDFQNGVDIGPNATLVLADSASLAPMAILNRGTFTIDRSSAFELNDSQNQLSGTGSFYKKGSGALTLSGNYAEATGTLFHEAGEIKIAGTYGGNYQQSSGAVLSPVLYTYVSGNAIFRGTLNADSILAVNGNASFDGAVINVKVSAINPVLVFGNTSFNGQGVTVNLDTFTPGYYQLFVASNSITNPNLLKVTKGGSNLTGREAFALREEQAYTFYLNLFEKNLALVWNGGSGVWNDANVNWREGSQSYAFRDYDRVVFNGNGNFTVDAEAATKTVSAMEVQSGNYTFTNGIIVGMNGGTWSNTDGRLLVTGTGTKATFLTPIGFHGGLVIGAGAKVVLVDTVLWVGMKISNYGELEIDTSSLYELYYDFFGLNGPGALRKKGYGHLSLEGDHSAATGTLYNDAGAIFFSGKYGGNYEQATDDTALIPTANSTILGDAYFRGTLSNQYGLSIGGNATFDGATISNIYVGNTLSVTGSATFLGTTNIVDIQFFTLGDHTILNANGGLSFVSANLKATHNGSELTGRRGYNWNNSNNQTLILTLTNDNLPLTWNDGFGSSIWDQNTINWINGGTDYAFVAQDRAIFEGSTPTTITVDTQAGLVSGMEVRSGDYTFDGEALVGRVEGSSSVNPDGKLKVMGSAKATFKNVLDFTGGIEIASGATLVLADGVNMATTGITNAGILEINQSGHFTLNKAINSLTGTGDIYKKGSGSFTLLGNHAAAEGTLYHQAGDMTFTGDGFIAGLYGGSYVQSSGVKLIVGADAWIGGNASFQGSLTTGHTLTISGAANFSGATIEWTPDQSQTVKVAGTINATGSVINLASFIPEYEGAILTSTVDLNPSLDNDSAFTVKLGGNAITGRMAYDLSISGKSLMLNLDTVNAVLTWVNTGSDGEWSTPGNWENESNQSESQLAGDKVIFTSDHQGEITLAQPAVVSDMTVESGSHTFKGDSITVTAQHTNLSANGLLEIESSAAATFENTVSFDSASIESGATLTLRDDGRFGGPLATVVNDGTLIFDVAVSKTQTLNGGSIAISGSGSLKKTGGGTLSLSGNFNSVNQAFSQEAGTVTLDGSLGGAYSLAYQASLVAADFSRIQGSTSIGGTLTLNGYLNLGSSAQFSNLSIVRFSSLTESRLAVSGAADFVGTVTIDINEFSTGQYPLINAASLNGLTDPNATLPVTLNGSALTPRQGHEWSMAGNALNLSLFSKNYEALWTGETSNSWDRSSNNWNAGGQKLFMDGDKAVFFSTGQVSVNLPSQVTVSDMLVHGGSFVFTGGTIIGQTVGTSLSSPTGKLEIINGGNVTLYNMVNFSGGVTVDSTSSLALAGNGQVLSGTVNLSGRLVFDSNSAYQPLFSVSGVAGSRIVQRGSGLITAATTFLSGFAGSYEHEAGGLTLGGTLNGNYSQTQSTAELIGSTDAYIAGNAEVKGKISGAATRVGGNANLSSAILNYNPLLLNSTPLLSVDGTLSFVGLNSINFTSFATGTTMVATGSTLNVADLETNFSAVTVGGQPLGQRQGANLSVSGNTLFVTLSSGENVVLIWNGGGTEWNQAGRFTEEAPIPQVNQFAHLDYVKFGATGAGTVNITGDVFVSGMEISAGNYRFTGGSLNGSVGPITGNRFTPTGELVIGSGATAEFQNRVAFVNGMTVASSATVILSGEGNFGGMTVANSGQVVFNRTADYDLGGHLSGGGDWVKQGTSKLTVVGNQSSVTGLLEHRAGTVALNGTWGGRYESQPGTSFEAAQGAEILGNATFRGSVQTTGQLRVVGQASFSNAQVTLDMAQTDSISAGSFAFSGSNSMTVTLASLTTGDHTLLRSAGTINPWDLSSWTLTPINHARLQASLAISDSQKDLILRTVLSNLSLDWNAAENRRWDLTSVNWSGGQAFLPGDQAVFAGTGAGEIIVPDAITTGRMTVSAGNYVFTGQGSIKGVVNALMAGSDGGLYVTGGSARLATGQAAQFAGDVQVGSGRLALATNLIAQGDFNLSPTGTLAFEGYFAQNGQNVELLSALLTANDIDLRGTLTAEITNLALAAANTPYQTLVAQASGNLTTAGAKVSGTKALFEYAFAVNGKDLVLTVTPKLGVTGLESMGGGPSTNTGRILESVQGGISSGVNVDGELRDVLLAAVNAGSLAEANAIVSQLSAVSVAQGVAQTRTVQNLAREFIYSSLGYEPYYLYVPASGYADSDWAVKTSVSGRWGRGRGIDADPAFKFKNGSAQLAVDRRLGDYRVGGAILAGHTDADWDNGASTDSQDLAGAIYLRHDLGDWFYAAQVFLGHSEVESTRRPGLGITATGDYDVAWSGVSVSLGHHIYINDWNVTPRVGGTYTSTRLDGFTEIGAGNLNFHYDSARLRSLELELGAFVSRDFLLDGSGMVLTPRLNVGLGLETLDTQVDVSTNFAEIPGLPAFANRSRDYGRLRFTAEAGSDLKLNESLTLSLDYHGSFRRAENNHGLTLGLGISY